MGSKISVHLAVWGLRLALIAPVIMLISGSLYRLRFVDFQTPLLAFAPLVLHQVIAWEITLWVAAQLLTG